MNQMYNIFKTDYVEWLGNEMPIDDVLLIGIRF
jgi:hypothetical protein